MQTFIDLNTKIANDSLEIFKQLGEINRKAAETIFEQQKEIFYELSAKAQQNMEKLATIKEPKEFMEVQSQLVQDSITSSLENWKKALAVNTTSGDAYRDLAEGSLKTIKSNIDKTAASVKQATKEFEKTVKPSKKAA